MSDDDTYEIPLQDQRVFGAGIKRQKVHFVPSSSSASKPVPTQSSATSISDRYLSLVLSKEETSGNADATASTTSIPLNEDEPLIESEVCEICSLPLSAAETSDPTTADVILASNARPHEASLAHQVCLTHSHPPSHLDRNRKGLAYLSSYGWDPDARRGLGASGQGIQFPIKAKPKDDKLGLGLVLPKASERMKKEKPVKLDAGKVRKLHEKDKKKAEKLREMFYRNDDLQRYLGGS
ncbi:hypothetical protein BP5796_05547 [Coleophoma crateriformis]|uniref:G-patch domain-containing protein n=1 Tax=Coleophoma crateriformis TaxID=565419 RepID=A0A3D8S3I5_9HELO|nr:hypothetical protein BP5796_05547 [Coleophoma crateriformis]